MVEFAMMISDDEFQRQLSQRIDEFVADVTRLAREHAVRTLAGALQVSANLNDEAVGRKKRTQHELNTTKQQLLDLICKEPGKRMLELAPILQTSAKDLALPVRQLITEKLIRTEGQRRSTTYYPTVRGRKRNGR